MVWSEDRPEAMIAVLESTSQLGRLADEIVSFVDRDADVTADQVDDLHDRLQRVQRMDTRPPVLNRDGPASVRRRGR